MPARFHVEITKAAERDLQEIWDFISQDKPEAASRFVLGLEKSILTLETFPERFPVIPEGGLLGVSYRHLVIDKYRTIFRIVGKTVYILRIIHGARLLDTSLVEQTTP